MKELEEMKLESGAEFDEGCKEFDEYGMVFVAVEGCSGREGDDVVEVKD